MATPIPGNVHPPTRWTAGAVVLGILAGGAPLWPVPYDSIELTGPGFLSQWILAGIVAGGLPAGMSRLPKFRIAGLVAIGFGIAVLARVVVETLQDPTDHNLWPFEVAIGSVVGLASGLTGALLARLLFRAKNS
jgi:hypothetical protein